MITWSQNVFGAKGVRFRVFLFFLIKSIKLMRHSTCLRHFLSPYKVVWLVLVTFDYGDMSPKHHVFISRPFILKCFWKSHVLTTREIARPMWNSADILPAECFVILSSRHVRRLKCSLVGSDFPRCNKKEPPHLTRINLATFSLKKTLI